MVNNDFKLNLYFELYKNTQISCRNNFRQMFTKKHGRFECLDELIFMIEQYQIEKYGETLYHSMAYAPSKKKRR